MNQDDIEPRLTNLILISRRLLNQVNAESVDNLSQQHEEHLRALRGLSELISAGHPLQTEHRPLLLELDELTRKLIHHIAAQRQEIGDKLQGLSRGRTASAVYRQQTKPHRQA